MTIRREIQIVLLTIVALAAWSCSDSKSEPGSASTPEQTPSAASADSSREGWPEIIRFGLVPSEGGTDIVDRFEPYFEHVSAELGIEVRPFNASEYIGVITAMQNDQIDAALFGPKSYVEANRIAGAIAIAKQLSDDGTEAYHSIIVTRKGSAIDSLASARGKRFGFVTPNSTSGYLVPSIGIIETTGERAETYFAEVSYTGTHSTAVRAVLAGDLDVAATNTLDLGAMVRSGLDATDLVELWRSDPIPGAAIAVRDDLPESFRDALRDATISFSENAEALERMARGGFVPAEDREYDIIRVLEERREELTGGS